jgi:hypothetical protein
MVKAKDCLDTGPGGDVVVDHQAVDGLGGGHSAIIARQRRHPAAGQAARAS